MGTSDAEQKGPMVPQHKRMAQGAPISGAPVKQGSALPAKKK
jgi:hypothetical protein